MEPVPEDLPCPACGSPDVVTMAFTDKFNLLVAGSSVALSARYPVLVCKTCGLTTSGEEGEIARESAVNSYLESLGK